MNGRREHPAPKWLKHGFLIAMLCLIFLSFYVMTVVAFKDKGQFNRHPWTPTLPLHWENWAGEPDEAISPRVVDPADPDYDPRLHVSGWEAVSMGIANSIFLAITGTCITLAIALLSAYVFGRYKFPGSRILWSMILVLMLMPGVANLIPLFNLMKHMRLLNSLWGLSIVGAAGGQIFALFVLRNFIEDMPQEFFECARIDGANHFQQIVHVVVPQCSGVISTLAILSFVGQWNNFIMPLIVMRDPDRLPLAVRLYYLQGAYSKEWGPLMAAYFISAVPLIVLFAFTMKLFIRGASEGAIKG